MHGFDGFAALCWVDEVDAGALVAEDGVEGVEFAQGGEDVVYSYRELCVSLTSL